ncbi:unnamed protein product [Gemmataceae bacterium]|nr:unnamed protein product [Gemmataceae bacterium]VTU02461.1 unnamed protein product [Gemmataceae bacterium]
MADLRDYKQFLRGLPPAEFTKFIVAYGGGDTHKTAESLIGWAETSGSPTEAAICQRIKLVFGVEILTSAERGELLAVEAVRLNARAADAADRSASAAEASAAEARQANETAKAALAASESNAFWTKAAVVVAVIALVISIVTAAR